MKRTFTLLGAVLLCLAGIIQPVKAETIASGTCGENLTWTLTDSGTLTISGTGEMYDPYSRPIGWMSYIGDIKKVLIEQGVTSIGSVAFRYCSNLISITIPEGVMSIGNEAFSGCTSLTSITIPEGVASIEDYAFSNCTSLTSITLPEGVTRIGNRAFDLCRSLTSITLPEDVTSIGDKAFDNCSGLIQITVQATTPPTVGDNPFFLVSRDIPVYVPAESLEAYQKADVWKEFNLQGMDQTSLSAVTILEQSIEVRDGEIILNCADRPLVGLYDLSGRLLYQSHDNRLAVPHPGTYIIRMGQEAVKVTVR